MHNTQIVCRKFVQFEISHKVLGNILYNVVHQSQIRLSIFIPMFNKRLPFTKSSRVIILEVWIKLFTQMITDFLGPLNRTDNSRFIL